MKRVITGLYKNSLFLDRIDRMFRIQKNLVDPWPRPGFARQGGLLNPVKKDSAASG